MASDLSPQAFRVWGFGAAVTSAQLFRKHGGLQQVDSSVSEAEI